MSLDGICFNINIFRNSLCPVCSLWYGRFAADLLDFTRCLLSCKDGNTLVENCCCFLFGRKLFSDSNTALILIVGLKGRKRKVKWEGSFHEWDWNSKEPGQNKSHGWGRRNRGSFTPWSRVTCGLHPYHFHTPPVPVFTATLGSPLI